MTILVAHIAFCIPFAYLPSQARMQGLKTRMNTRRWTFMRPKRKRFRVPLPLMMPGIISGFLLAFIVSLDDFIITNFVKGAGIETLAHGDLWFGETRAQAQHHGDLYDAAWPLES